MMDLCQIKVRTGNLLDGPELMMSFHSFHEIFRHPNCYPHVHVAEILAENTVASRCTRGRGGKETSNGCCSTMVGGRGVKAKQNPTSCSV